MGKTLKEVKAGLSKERQEKISDRASDLIATEAQHLQEGFHLVRALKRFLRISS